MTAFVILRQNNTAPHYFTPNASISWAGGYAPSLGTSNGNADIFNFISYNGGTNWYGSRVMQV